MATTRLSPMRGVRAPHPIQLAIQGGGAKICGLAAVMDALQECEARGLFHVTGIAGTSAGAVVGCLYAGGASFSQLRAKALQVPKQWISSVFPKRTRLGALARVLFNRPIWDENVLASVLSELLSQIRTSDGTLVTDLDSLRRVRGISVSIVTTDLRDSQSRVFSTEQTPSVNVVDAILDSCAIPFYLRTGVGQGRVLVDGGICENFPANLLVADSAELGPIVGVGFARKPVPAPSNALQLASALLETAMNSSMHRARQKVGRDFMHEIDTDVSTFAFDEAIATGFGRSYDAEKARALRFFEALADSLTDAITGQLIQADPWATGDRTTLERVGTIYRVLSASKPMEYIDSTLEVTLNSVAQRNEHGFGLADISEYRLRFRTAGHAIQAHSVAVIPTTPHKEFGLTAQYLNERRWSFCDQEGKRLQMHALPAFDADSPHMRRMVFFFDPPLDPEADRERVFTFSFRDLTDQYMAKLSVDGADELGLNFPRATGHIGHARLVLHVPASSSVRFEADGRPQNVHGRFMNESELVNFPSPVGFRTLGWCAENIPAGKWLVTQVRR